jgi:hypothetical protein
LVSLLPGICLPSALPALFILGIGTGTEKVVTVDNSPHVWPVLLYFSIHFACLEAGINATVNPRRPRLVIPLCIHPIRTPYVEKS